MTTFLFTVALRRRLGSLIVIGLLGGGPVAAQVPALVSTAPTRHTVAAPRSANVALTFSQLMNAGTASNAAVRVFSQQRGGLVTRPGGGTFSGGGSATITFNPATDFRPGEVVSVTATPAAQSTGGQALAPGKVVQFTAAAAPASAAFSSGVDLAMGFQPACATAADIDGDGDLDLLTGDNSVTGTVTIRHNDGTGAFGAPVSLSVNGFPAEIITADLDGDSDLDILTVAQIVGTVSLRFNDGTGTFSGTTEVVVGTFPKGIAVGDLDADGDLDLLAANSNDATVSVRFNNGAGTFSGTTEVSVSGGPHTVTTGDVDNDGDLDLITANGTNMVSIRHNDGAGAFTAPGGGADEVTIGPGCYQTRLADVDADGDLDLLATSYNGNTISICPNDGTGLFGTAAVVPVSGQPSNLTTADVDGDGDLDLLATIYATPGKVSVHLNTSGSFGSATEVVINNTPVHIGAADFDGDGTLDLFSTSFVSSNVAIRYNDAPAPTPFALISTNPVRNAANVAASTRLTAVFNQPLAFASTSAVRFFTTQGGGGYTWVLPGFGGPNSFELVPNANFHPGEMISLSVSQAARSASTGLALARSYVQEFRVAAGTGPGSFLPHATLAVPALPRAARPVDVDADGDLDLLVASLGANNVSVRRNNGSASFGANVVVANVPTPHDMAVGDLDNDGDLDLVTVNHATAGRASIRLNDGTGTYSGTTEVTVGDSPARITLGDVDGDGDLDLLTVNESDGTVSIARNDGTATVTTVNTVTVGLTPQDLTLTDIDNDGDLDLLTALGGNALSILRNDGTGTFGSLTMLATGGNTTRLTVGDLDNDGDNDVVAVVQLSTSSHAVKLYANDGTGTFGFVRTVGDNSTVQALALADVKGDGRLAIVVTRGGGELVTEFNLGSLRFVTDSLGHPLTGTNALDVALGDFDGDLDLDVVTANISADNVSVLLNRLATPTDDFYLVNGTPQSNVSNVAPNAVFDLTFNEPPRTTSLPTPVVATSSAQANPWGGGSSSGNDWTIINTSDWFPGSRVDYTIAGARSARTGRLMRRPYVRQFWVAAGLGQGSLTPAPAYNLTAPGYSLLTDVNRDHQLDLVIASTVTNNVRLCLGTGTGTFGPPTTLVSGGLPVDVQAADLNHDGFQDLLVANNSTNDVSVRLGSPTGTFTSVANVPVNGNAQYLIVADFDADTHLDLAVSNPSASTISVRFGTGTGTFGRPQNLALGQQPGRIVTFDVDADGDLDLLSANYTPTLSLLRNDGTGHFAAPAQLALSETPQDVVVADFNQDGYPDVFAVSAVNPMLYVERLMGSASGTLVPASRLAYNGTFTTSVQLATADLTGDGYPDLLINNFNFLRLLVVPNTSAGFGTPQTISLPGSAYGITTGDINNDLAVDVALPLTADNQVRVLLNAAPDLVVNTVASIPGGSYRHITVTGTGRGTLTGDVRLTGTLTVQAGGELGGTDGRACYRITGPGNFVVAPGSTFHICDIDGIAATGPTGMVQVTGSRTYASEASYAFNGPSFQWTGNGLPASIDNLIQANVFGLSLTQAVAVRREVRFAASGNLLDGNRLTLLSNATSSAMLINAGPGRVVGAATVQRWINPALNRGLGYRHLSSPVAATTVADLTCAGFAPYVNPAYNTLPRPALPMSQFPLVFGYDERRAPASLDFYDGYFSPTTVADPLVMGRGYTVLISGNLTPDFVGTLTQDDVTLPSLTRTGSFMASNQKSGWHLLGNPFPSPLDWDLVPVPPGMSSSISVFRSTGPNTGTYVFRAGGIGSLPDGLLPVGQGFFARVTGTGPVSLTLPSAARPTSYTNPAYYRAAPDQRPLLSLTLGAAGAADHDETFVALDAAATLDLDDAFDAPRPGRNPGAPTLATLIGTDEAAINVLPTTLPAGGLTVELLAVAPTPGTWELAVGQAQNLDSYDVALLDRLTNTRYPLASHPTLRFSTTQPNEEIRHRFALVFNGQHVTGTNSSSLIPHSSLALWPNPSTGVVQVQIPAAATRLEVLDLTGRVVLTETVLPATTHTLQAALPKGVYVVRAGAASVRWVVE